MARYIDADALVAELQKKPIHDGHFIHTRDVSDAIFYAPTISPDEVRGVVLCQDCDCWNEWDHAGRKSLGNYVCSCAHWTVEDGAVLYTKPTDFCSYGERKVTDDA